MRIGSDDNWVCLERVGPPSPASVCRFTAAAAGAGWRFAAAGEQALVYVSNDNLNDFADFNALKIHQIELGLSDGGWLRIKRHIKGFIVVRYRATCRKLGAALEGEIVLEAEAAKAFCDDFITLLCKQ
jgi:hypothetical protein